MSEHPEHDLAADVERLQAEVAELRAAPWRARQARRKRTRKLVSQAIAIPVGVCGIVILFYMVMMVLAVLALALDWEEGPRPASEVLVEALVRIVFFGGLALGFAYLSSKLEPTE